MASREIFRFELDGISAMIDTLDQFEKEMDQRLEKALIECAELVIADARRLTHNLSGDLEASLNIGEVKKTINGYYIQMGTSPEVDDYAVVQHEGFRKTKDGKIIPLTPGEKTLSKGSYKGYTPGRKFLENAIKINEKVIIEKLAAGLRI